MSKTSDALATIKTGLDALLGRLRPLVEKPVDDFTDEDQQALESIMKEMDSFSTDTVAPAADAAGIETTAGQ